MPMRTDSIQYPHPEVKPNEQCSLCFDHYAVTHCIATT